MYILIRLTIYPVSPDMETTSSVQNRATAHVAAVIEHLQKAGTRQLPTIRQLARDAGVSHWTVSKVVRNLKRSGTVEASRSRGIRLCSASDAHTVFAASRQNHIWQRIRGTLLHDLVNGSFGFNRPLPSHKELALRYAVATNTLRKALDALTEENVLTRHKRSYRMVAPDLPTGRNSIVLFARGTESGSITNYSLKTRDDFRSMEYECRSRNIILHSAPCYYTGPSAAEMTFSGRKDNSFPGGFPIRNILGFMIWQTGISEEFCNDLLRFLQPRNKPIALFFDDAGPSQLTGISAFHRAQRFAFMTDRAIGRRAGLYLLALGHRRICCLNADKEKSWSIDRIGGICDAFEATGYRDAVDIITVDATIDAYHREAIGRVMADLTEDRTIALQFDNATSLNMELNHDIRREIIRKRFSESFRRLAKDRSITAWVGLNDEIAIEGLTYLRSHDVEVPGTISVMGFDDSIEAGYHGLTSYCFNGHSAMHLMTEYLVRPNSPLIRTNAGEAVVVEGFVQERTTTGRARR
jgi:DNA-binding LacI/PurR family transcriptional regulator